MRRGVAFKSEGLTCGAWLDVPDDLPAGQKAPAIVMAHGISGVKEMHLNPFIERFVAAGFVTLTFDYRYAGESEGEPRGRIFPAEQIEDYRNAITWLSELPEVDPGRIGVWGTSFSGGHVLHVGAYDRRVKVVVSQVPSVNPYENMRRFRRPDLFFQLLDLLTQDRVNRYKTGQVNSIPLVAPPGELCAMPIPEAYEFNLETSRTVAPNWVNRITVESIEKAIEYNPGAAIHLISPKPLLMIVAAHDVLTPVDITLEAYARAREPKAIHVLPVGHFAVYSEPWQSKAADLAAEWFARYL